MKCAALPMTDLKSFTFFSASMFHVQYKLETSMSNSHVLVRSLVHIQGGPKCICIACSGQMRDLNPFHILVQAKSACSHMPTLSRTCPAFLQASTRRPLARMQEIVGRTNVMAIRFSLFAFSSPNNASFVHRMPQTFSQPTKVLLWKSS